MHLAGEDVDIKVRSCSRLFIRNKSTTITLEYAFAQISALHLRLLDCLNLDRLTMVGRNFDFLLNLRDIELRHLGIVAVDNLCQLFERRTFCLDIIKIDESQLQPNPALA